MPARARLLSAIMGCTAACASSPEAPHQPRHAPAAPADPEPAAPVIPSTTASAPAATPEAPALERIRTGQEQPTVAVHNGYPAPQHVFIDGRPVGQIATGGQATFEVTPGVHTVTCSDSADPDDNPSSVTEAIEKGYAYRYRILAK